MYLKNATITTEFVYDKFFAWRPLLSKFAVQTLEIYHKRVENYFS